MEQLIWLVVIICAVLLVFTLIKKTVKFAIVIAIALIIASYFGIQVKEIVALKDNPVVIEMMKEATKQPDNAKLIYETYKGQLPQEVIDSIEKYGVDLVFKLIK